MVNKREVQESIDSYLGDSEKIILKTIDKKTLALFLSKKIKLNTSYFVKGNEKLLKQFKAFYLVLRNKDSVRLKHGKYMLSEYVRNYLSITTPSNIDDIEVEELLFLYAHENGSGTDKLDAWMSKAIINEISNRNRKDYTTIILSERSIPEIEKSKEVEVINLFPKSKNGVIQSKGRVTITSNSSFDDNF